MDSREYVIRMSPVISFSLAILIIGTITIPTFSTGSAPVMDDDNEIGYLHCEN